MRHIFIWCLLNIIHILAMFSISHAGEVDIKIRVVTENSFPVQYIENGKISGPGTKLVKQVLSTSGLSYDIEVLPWARAYYLATHEPNVLIYSLAKTPARMQLFKWVGRIKSLNYYLYGHEHENINFQTPLETLKQYKIGTVRDSAVYQYLTSHGFKKLTTVVRGQQNFLLFEQNRIDLLPINKFSFAAICMRNKLPCEQMKPLYKLDMPSVDLYMAFSKLTDDALVEKVQAAYNIIASQHSELIGVN